MGEDDCESHKKISINCTSSCAEINTKCCERRFLLQVNIAEFTIHGSSPSKQPLDYSNFNQVEYNKDTDIFHKFKSSLSLITYNKLKSGKLLLSSS